MSDNLELDRVTRKAKEPAKAWRNKWRATQNGIYKDGSVSVAGKIIWGSGIWPSREIAEDVAHRDMSIQASEGFLPDEWLGAFPVPTT